MKGEGRLLRLATLNESLPNQCAALIALLKRRFDEAAVIHTGCEHSDNIRSSARRDFSPMDERQDKDRCVNSGKY